MATVSLPKGNIPFGWATVAGQRVPVTIDTEWMRALSDMLNRIGGTTGTDTSSIGTTALEALSLANSAQLGFFQRPQPTPAKVSDSADLLMARAFNRAPIAPQTPADDAASILANRVFRK